VFTVCSNPWPTDVFLTPLKPKEKVVSAEDITSSLYYLHVDQPEDANMLQETSDAHESAEESVHQETAGARQASSITRKPVPPARPSADGRNQPFDIPRKPPSNDPVTANPPRKPLGARPLVPRKDAEHRHNMAASISALRPDDHNFQKDSYSRRSFEDTSRTHNENIDPRGLQFRNPFLADGQRPGAQLSSTPPYAHAPGIQSGSSVSFTDLHEALSAANPSVSLTLIRRDPGSGAQWNVAKIRYGSSSDAASASHRGTKLPGAPIYLEILTPGYSKFLYDDEPPALVSRNSGLSATSVDSVGTSRSGIGRTSRQTGPRLFSRRLWMEGSGRLSNSFSWDRKGSKDSCPLSSEPKRSGDFGMPKSYDLEPEDYFANSGEEGHGDHGRSKFRGYVFTSPWGGRCEFTTGHTGKTLKVSSSVLSLAPSVLI
jgi:hypothetical protein